MKNWFSIKNKTTNSEGVVDISIHDEIGLWGITAKDFIAELKSFENVKAINLSIHSPGGSVLDGFAIYNVLKNHPAKVYGRVEGIAASAASFILMASDVIEMPEDSFLMIHNAWGMAIGDADELRETADMMDKLQDSIVNIYEKRSGLDTATIRDMMKSETWMNADDALKNGFIDTITDKIDLAAKINVFNRYFKNMPIENKAGVEDIENEKDFEKCLRDAGLSKRLAEALTSRAKLILRSEPVDEDSELSKLSAALDKVKIANQISD